MRGGGKENTQGMQCQKKETKGAEKEVNEGGMEDSPLLSPFHHTRISSYVPLANSHNIARMESLLAG